MDSTYNIKIISENDSISIINSVLKTFRVICNNEEYIYSAEDITAVLIKTMDTGPSVEDMYAEVYIYDTIYIIISESRLFKTLILDTIGSLVSLNLKLFIEASTYHFNKTFVLYQIDDVDIEYEDSDDKKIAVLEASIKLIQTGDCSAELCGFVFAVMSFCPMYLLYSKGKFGDELVNISAINKNLIPIYTTLDRCPNEELFERRRHNSSSYVKLLISGNNDAVVNFNSDCPVKISLQQLQNILLPLVLLREETENKRLVDSKQRKKKELLKKLFRRK